MSGNLLSLSMIFVSCTTEVLK